jgi:glycosyltransferase involved in cell wall biosynthesis
MLRKICVYGTVYNNASTVEESIKSVWKPEYEIVIVDNYSTDGTWEKLLGLRKEYNLRAYRYRCSRGLGRNIALHMCPENSITAYFDLDTRYNYAYHKIIEASQAYGSMSAPGLVVVEKEFAIRRGGWRDLNVGEDSDFAVKIYPKAHVPVIVGENASPGLAPIWREKRYAKTLLKYVKRLVKIHLDSSIAYGLNPYNLLMMGSKRLTILSPLLLPYARFMRVRNYYDALPTFSIENLERLSRVIPPREVGIREDLFFLNIDYLGCRVVNECSILDEMVKTIVSPPIIKFEGLSKIYWKTYFKSLDHLFMAIPQGLVKRGKISVVT